MRVFMPVGPDGWFVENTEIGHMLILHKHPEEKWLWECGETGKCSTCKKTISKELLEIAKITAEMMR
jgi:ferredoxin